MRLRPNRHEFEREASEPSVSKMKVVAKTGSNARWSVWICAAVWTALLGVSSAVHASVNLPLHHWTYDAIERLVSMGLIEDAMVVTKPYSRKLAARYVARAVERYEQTGKFSDAQAPLAEPLLERLMREFQSELSDLGVVAASASTKPGLVRYGGRVQLEADAFSVGHGGSGLGVRFRENRGGEYYANGEQIQGDVRGWIELTDIVSLVVQPKYITNAHALGQGATDNSKNAYMREMSLKISYWNVAFEVGRGTQWWGPGYRGSLMLTDHAFPLDMVKLGSEEPFRLPWIMRDLGQWRINSFLAQLERDRDFPRAKVFGLRIGYLPASWFELGLTRMTQFNGRGNPQSFPGIIPKTYFGSSDELTNKVNEQAMIDFRMTLPKTNYLIPFPSGLQFYGEIGSEDKWTKFPLPTRAAVLGGIYIPQLIPGDTLDLRIEYGDTDLDRRRTGMANDWYNSATYRSGMRYRGFPLGHWMGPDATDYFLRSTRYMTDQLQLGLNVEYSERGKGEPVHEKKREAGLDLTWWLTPKFHFTVSYTYQHIENPGQITRINPFQETFQAGLVSDNHFAWTNLVFEF